MLLMGKSTISRWPFSLAMLNYQRVASQIVFGSIGVKFVILIDNLLNYYIYIIQYMETN